MCLDAGHHKVESSTLIQSGWKKFNGYEPDLMFEAMSFGGAKRVPLDKWITAEGKGVQAIPSYDAGFHIYEDEKETRPGNRRVYYRNVHRRGRQSGCTVIVAKEIYVPSNPDDWPPKG